MRCEPLGRVSADGWGVFIIGGITVAFCDGVSVVSVFLRAWSWEISTSPD